MNSFGRSTISSISRFRRLEVPQANFAVVECDARVPKSGELVQSDALISGGVRTSHGSISVILYKRCRPQVSAPVVQPVPVAMITLPVVFRGQSKNRSMHQKRSFLASLKPQSSRGIKQFGCVTSCGVPIELRKPFVIGSIHDSHESLGQGNRAIFWFGWGCHFGSLKPEMCGRLPRPQPHSIPPVPPPTTEFRGYQ